MSNIEWYITVNKKRLLFPPAAAPVTSLACYFPLTVPESASDSARWPKFKFNTHPLSLLSSFSLSVFPTTFALLCLVMVAILFLSSDYLHRSNRCYHLEFHALSLLLKSSSSSSSCSRYRAGFLFCWFGFNSSCKNLQIFALY